MYVVCITVHVAPGRANDFIEATLKNASGTRKEPGNVRFDVLRAIDDENRFFLYEVYKTPADFTAHQQTKHYLNWRETVQDWMAEKRQGVKHRSIFPTDDEW
ncbi:MAG: antibiotic biosynthesis monooxygenase [Candidatus Omnitrophota bacterium]|jgi:autoinducer 2-degrading protein|nr:MAG: antibiotic biosynthesis monooxygenase [Candidatus Omnitrophota bacterium]